MLQIVFRVILEHVIQLEKYVIQFEEYSCKVALDFGYPEQKRAEESPLPVADIDSDEQPLPVAQPYSQNG